MTKKEGKTCHNQVSSKKTDQNKKLLLYQVIRGYHHYCKIVSTQKPSAALCNSLQLSLLFIIAYYSL